MNIDSLKGKTIAFAASGGLDSCTITHWLSQQGVNVICLTADLGQPDENNFDEIKERMLSSGAKEFISVDLKSEMAKTGLEVIQCGAKYEGDYWNLTAAARQVIIKGFIPILKKKKINILSHGATGRGNDQFRFQITAAMYNPDLSFYVPWRDPKFLEKFKGRKEMIKYCTQHSIPIKASANQPYSTDANLLGLTHEGGEIENLETPMTVVTSGMGKWPLEAQELPKKIRLSFLKGVPIRLNNKNLDLQDLFETLNIVAGEHGIGIAENLIENRFIGVKSRGVYESPAMTTLAYAYNQLLQQILDKRALELYRLLSTYLGTQLYQGYWVDLGSIMARNAVVELTNLVTGDIVIEMYKGNLIYISTEGVTSGLYNADSSMENEGNLSHEDATGLLNILTLCAKNMSIKRK